MAVNGFDDGKNKVSVYTTVEIDTNKQDKHQTAQITLFASLWAVLPDSSSIGQTIGVTGGITETNTVLVSPVWVSAEEYNNCKVYCIDQRTDILVFACDPNNIPQNDLFVNVLVLGD